MSMRSVLSNVVPPPAYLLMPSVGVDISDTSLKYVAFDPNRTNRPIRTLSQWGNIDIPTGILNRGEVLDPEKLSAILTAFKKRTGATYVRVSLPEERAYLFETEIKRDIPFKEVRGLLEFRLEENVPIPPRDAVFDYDIIDDELDEKDVRVTVAAYAKDTIMSYYEACRVAGLMPLSFEVEAQAIARATVAHTDQNTHMIVDFGKTRTGMGIVHRGQLMYTSTIDIGGNELSRVLRRQLGVDIPEEELTTIKNNKGLIKGADSTDVHDALITTLSVIKDEIMTRLQYWHTRDYHRQERRIQSIILCGGSANLKGLPEYLTETTGIKTERAQVWRNAFDVNTTIPPITQPYAYGYATAIGLALQDTV